MTTGADILREAQARLGALYRWGAVGPGRYDCMGLVEAIARALGHPFGKEMSAAMGFVELPRVKSPKPGRLVYFRSKRGAIVHVEIVESVDGNVVSTIGATGGNSTTVNDAIAGRQNARVKRCVRDIQSIAGITLFPGQDDGRARLPVAQEPEPDRSGETERPEEII